jgi:hypothetical protein
VTVTDVVSCMPRDIGRRSDDGSVILTSESASTRSSTSSTSALLSGSATLQVVLGIPGSRPALLLSSRVILSASPFLGLSSGSPARPPSRPPSRPAACCCRCQWDRSPPKARLCVGDRRFLRPHACVRDHRPDLPRVPKPDQPSCCPIHQRLHMLAGLRAAAHSACRFII